MEATPLAPQGATLTFEAFCQIEKEMARHALRSNWREQAKVEALWRRFSSRLEELCVAPASTMDLGRTMDAVRRTFIADHPGLAERAATRDHLMRLNRAHTAARQYERSLLKLRLPFLSRDEIENRAANWAQASERLDLDYGDSEVMRAAYAIYGPKGG